MFFNLEVIATVGIQVSKLLLHTMGNSRRFVAIILKFICCDRPEVILQDTVESLLSHTPDNP
jgi:hypothetical protein